ncbi:MAG: MaoC family dehydratase [Spongiibacteraceae bacterium]
MPIVFVSKDQMADQLGNKLGPTPWISLDQDRINGFADITEDHQFIHIDEELAAQGPFGGTIAHGFLSLSMLSKLFENDTILPEGVVMGINYGFDKVRFLAPVRAGKRIRGHGEVIKVERKDDNRFLTTVKISVEIEGEETPALVAEWLMMTVTA